MVQIQSCPRRASCPKVLSKQGLKAPSTFCVERVRRLIEQPQGRFVEHQPCERNASALTYGEGLTGMIQQMPRIQGSQTLANGFDWCANQIRRQLDILFNRQAWMPAVLMS